MVKKNFVLVALTPTARSNLTIHLHIGLNCNATPSTRVILSSVPAPTRHQRAGRGLGKTVQAALLPDGGLQHETGRRVHGDISHRPQGQPSGVQLPGPARHRIQPRCPRTQLHQQRTGEGDWNQIQTDYRCCI